MRRLSQSLMLIVAPVVLTAQDSGPAAGTWGGEGSLAGSGALLRFRNDASAVVFGLATTYSDESSGSPFGGDRVSISTRFGLRRYSRVAERTRPYRTLIIEAAYDDIGSLTQSRIGVGAEFGAAHFFTQHISLGAAGDLIASVTNSKVSSSFSGSSTSGQGKSVRFSGFRVFGGVYF